MLVFPARNANQALPEMMYQLANSAAAVKRNSRFGPVLQFCEPVSISYRHPAERVVFWPERDCNPFFHLFESLWMLAGRNDVAYPVRFSSQMAQFSDNGETFHGAYGHRWRRHFGVDQLKSIAEALKANPEDRRQVLQMWDATADLGKVGKDFPCNLMITFQRDSNGHLDMQVFNRSNDIVWGALGANCVHMSMLQEFMAHWIGCKVGRYWQTSSNMHAYEATMGKCLPLGDKAFPSTQYKTLDPYERGEVGVFPLVQTDIDQWQGELGMFLEVGAGAIGYGDPFFRRVAIPMLRAHEAFSRKDNPRRFGDAIAHLDPALCDWHSNAVAWLLRRFDAAKAKAA